MEDQELPMPASGTLGSPIQEPTADDDNQMAEPVEEEPVEEEPVEEEPVDPPHRRHSPAVKDSRDIYWHGFGS